MISAGRGGFVRFFQSKIAGLAFYQSRLLVELVVAELERELFGFLPICASKLKFRLRRVALFVRFIIFQLHH